MKHHFLLAGLIGSAACAQTLPAPPVSPAPVTKYEYDAQGNPTKTIQAPGTLNLSTRATYDRLSRLKDSTDAKLGKTQFSYDGLDRTLKITDPRNLVTQTPRDGLGNPTQLISPDTGTASHTVDAAGNLKTRTDSRGVKATHTYDTLNRLTQTVFSQGANTQAFSWTYDQTGTGFTNGVGRLTSSAHPNGSTQTTYDPQGRVLTETQRVKANPGANPSQIVHTVSTGYDAAGHITRLTYPSGRLLTITHTGGVPSAMALAKNSTAAATPLISQIQWEPFGGAKSWLWQMASGTQLHERVSDTSGRVVRYRLGNNVRDLSYDAADRISAYTHRNASTGAAFPSLDQSFGYDALGRLTQTTLASGAWNFSYDANGNRTASTVGGSTSNVAIAPASNRIASISNPSRSFTYDSAGNITADGQFSAGYDLSGRMGKLTKAGVTTSYAYDGFGRRVRKFSSTGTASTVIFVYDQAGQLLGEYDSTGQAIREIVWLGTTPIAVFMPDPVSVANPPLIYYIHTDHLDTPRVVIDKNNKVRWRWLSEPFGVNAAEDNLNGLGVFTFNLRFPGQVFDQESGLHYNWFRSYDSGTGRYTTSDPIGLAGGSMSTYTYVNGDPISKTDPMGLCPMCLIPALPYVAEIAIIGATWWASQQVKTPNQGPPGGWITNPGNGQERLYGPNGKPEVDIDWHPDHGQGTPHGHNWGDGRRGPGIPLSPWPQDRRPDNCSAK